MNRTIKWIVVSLTIATLISCTSTTDNKEANGELGNSKAMSQNRMVKEWWGSKWETISKADMVNVYDVTLNETDPGIQFNLAEIKSLNPQQIETLNTLLSLDSSYDFVRAKKTPFLPSFAFGYGEGKDMLVVYVMPEASMLAYINEGSMKIEDYDSVSETINALLVPEF